MSGPTQNVGLKDQAGADAMGLVNDSPAANTILGRLKAIADAMGAFVLGAGSAIIGKVGFDITTPGTTNAVAPIAGQNGVAAGAGAVGATVQRMTLASDDPAVAHLANLVSRGKVVRPSITADTNAYVSGDSLFDVVTLSGVMAATGGSTKLKSLCIKDTANQAAAMELYLFRATPVGGTYTANSAVDFDASDWADLLHMISIESGDWSVVDGLAQVSISWDGIMLDSATTDLFLVAVSKGTPTYAADSISMAFGFERS